MFVSTAVKHSSNDALLVPTKLVIEYAHFHRTDAQYIYGVSSNWNLREQEKKKAF